MEAAAVADNWETISLESFRRTLPPQGRVDTGYALEILALSISGEGEYECSEANYK